MRHTMTLPQYSVRRSARARRVRLTVTPQHGLVVVLPNGWSGDVDAVVASKQAWADRALAQVAERRAAYLAGPETLRPDVVELRAQSRVLRVIYEQTDSASARARVRDGVLVVSGSSDADAQLAALRRWIVAEAKRWLPGRVADIVRVQGIAGPAELRVSTARTRWGSCSGRARISLNRTLLFVAPELADYVIAHELAHLTHLDHSPRFWATLASMDEHSLEHRAAMKGAGRFVPAWVDA